MTDTASGTEGLAIRLVDAMNAVHGAHTGRRAAHARGASAEGMFRARPEAVEYSRAAHFQGAEIPVLARFSNASGNPDVPDGARDGRGLAVKFRLPTGKATDIVCVTLPCFTVRRPEHLLELLAARRADPATGVPDPAALAAFVAAHPESLPALQAAAASEPAASYARCRYNGIHAFRLTNAAGESLWARYRWEPAEGVATLADAEAMALAPDYLSTDLHARLASGEPVGFTLLLQLAAAGDDIDDAATAWPEARTLVPVGELSLTTAADEAGEAAIFDPTRVTDGIECTEDPILHARSAAYGESYRRRKS